MKFTPKTEEQIAKEGLIPEGTYSFQVNQAAEETSKSGNDMIHLELFIYTEDGRTRTIDDYLLEKMAYKLRHFCAVTGLIDQYQQGTLCADDCHGKTGLVQITIKPDKSGQYPPRNQVKDYVLSAPVEATAPVRASDPAPEVVAPSHPSDEDVPF